MDFAPLATALTTIATGTFAFVKWWLPWRNEKKRNAHTISGMQSISRVYETMKQMECSVIDRVILFAGHNGGGIPSASKPFYVTAVHWVADAVSSKVIENYVNVRVDADYIAMLLTIRERGYVALDTLDMPECKLKQYYLLEGVTHSIKVFLTVKDQRFYYVSAATKSPDGIDAKARAMVLLKAESLVNELERKSATD